MKHLIHTLLIIACAWGLRANAQTPYGSFAPETSRPMLGVAEQEVKTDSILCAVVTDTQHQMLLFVDVSNGQILAIAPITDDLCKWLSVDPLADKYPHISPYAYCGWNPVNAIDSDGKEWTDIDGNIVQDHSNIKAYIFYNKKDFGSQTMQMYSDLEEKYGKGSVAISDVRTTREFKQDWQNMSSGNIQEVNINHHGNNQTIILDNNPESPQYITSTGNGLSNRSYRPALNIGALGNPQGNIMGAILNLNTCHSNSKNRLGWISERIFGPTLKGTGQTLMESFVYNHNFNSVRGTSAGVSYNRKTLQPEPQFFFQSWMYYSR